MNKELASQFTREVECYRRSLLYRARTCEWTSFEDNAGKLFDYVESVEVVELEKRFFRMFFPLLATLVLFIVTLVSLDFNVHQDLLRLKSSFILGALALSSYEIYFFLAYRHFIEIKSRHYARRREKFIRGIEQDFRNYVMSSGQKQHDILEPSRRMALPNGSVDAAQQQNT